MSRSEVVISGPQRRGFGQAVKQVVLQYLGANIVNLRQISPTLGSGTGAGGIASSTDQALQLSTFWACVRLISQTVGTLPLNYYKSRSGGGRELATDDPLFSVLHDMPNSDMTASQFWEAIVASLLLWGNGFAEIVRSGIDVIALNFLRPEGMTAKRNVDTGAIEYTYTIGGKTRQIAPGDMLHICGFSLDGIFGMSPIAAGRYVLGSAMATDAAARNLFVRGMLMRGTFETDAVVKDSQREAFKLKLQEYQGILGAGGAPLLEAGIKYAPIDLNPDDAQMLATRQFNVEEICRFMGVPPFMVGHSAAGDTGWGTGLEQRKIAFLTFSLRFWLVRIEQAISRSLIPPIRQSRYKAEFALEGLLRADSAARAAYYQIMVQNGLMTRDEIRGLENLPPMGGNAGKLTVQNIMLPLDDLGAAATPPAGDAAKSALQSWLGIMEKAPQ